MCRLRKALALLLSIVLVLSLCGFAEQTEEGHTHEDESAVVETVETVVEEAVSDDAVPEFDALMESDTEIDVEEAPAL